MYVFFYKTRVEPGFLEKSASRNTMNSMEQKTIVFCHIDVQEYHLWWILQKTIIYSGFKTLYKISTKQENSSLFMDRIFITEKRG
jgi:hypothetical protein